MAEEKKKPNSGRKSDQKMKPYLVYDYLMRRTDTNHVASGNEIAAYLQDCGIPAERRSIYTDIEEINKAILLTTRDNYGLPKAETIEEAEERQMGRSDSSSEWDAPTDANDTSGKVNLNTASLEQLMEIPGVGESKAKAIINYRNTNGGFSSIEEVMNIEGIKEGVFSKMKEYIVVN